VVKVADPEMASVPAWAVFKNWDVLTPRCAVRYCRKTFISPLKLVMVPLVGRKENTWFEPFEPEKRFQVCPASDMLVTVGTALPLEEYEAAIGFWPKEASQIMTSLTLLPPEVLEVNKS